MQRRTTLPQVPWRPGRNGIVCRFCERHISECGPLSARGKCSDCGVGKQAATIIDMHTHSGYFFQRWRRGMAASVGGVLLDDVQPDE